MTKEFEVLEAKPEDIGKLLYEVYDVPSGICEYINNALTELKAIKEAKPSEALKCIDVLKEDGCITTLYQGNALETIRQALLKAQEQESKTYLKWEDLEFSYKEKSMKVKLNNNIYTLKYEKNVLMDFATVFLEFNNTEIIIIECKKQFFNDLHLERVE